MANSSSENYVVHIQLKDLGVDSMGNPLACSAALNAWSRVFSSFGRREYKKSDEVVTLKFDDNHQFIEYTNQFFSLISDTRTYEDAQVGWELTVPILKIHATVKSLRAKLVKYRIIKNYIDLFMSEFFLAMNLAAPGSFSIRGSNFSISIENSIDLLTFSLNGDDFWHLWNNELNTDLISYFSIVDTCNWLKRLQISNKFIAGNSIERAIFALLEYSENKKSNPSSIIHLSHLIESIYKIKPDLNILSTLKKRIPEVLKISNTKLDKKLGIFYEFRSQFVHGSLDSLHFLADSIYDEEISEIENKIVEVESFAFLIAYLSLRKFVENDWVELEFKESFEGKKLNN
jgi:hypothetical protein